MWSATQFRACYFPRKAKQVLEQLVASGGKGQEEIPQKLRDFAISFYKYDMDQWEEMKLGPD